jgi:hypothetical protein
MNTIRKAVIVAISLLAANAAHAQFGALGGMLGGSKSAASTGDIGAEVTAFMTKSAALSAMASRSLTAINAAFASDEEIAGKRATLASINQITDPKEKEAKIAALYESESAEAKRRLSSGEMEQKMGGLDSAKKKQIGDAILNFGIGTLQAVELTKSGQSLLQQAGSNPMNLPKVLPVKNAIPLLGKVAGDAGGFFVGVIKLAKGANISIPVVKADTKQADVPV